MDLDIMTEDDFAKLEEIYMLFASVPRLKILLRLNSGGECSSGDLALEAGLSQTAASHQLKDLRRSKIVKSRKDGAKVLYSLDDHHIINIIESAMQHIRGENCNEESRT